MFKFKKYLKLKIKQKCMKTLSLVHSAYQIYCNVEYVLIEMNYPKK